MLGSITPKVKLTFSIVILSVIFLMLSLSLINFKYSKSQSLVKLESAVILATKLSRILHETQKERGMTAGFISNNGKKFKEQLSIQRKKTTQRIIELNQFLHTINLAHTSKGIQDTLKKALNDIKNLNIKRKSIDKLLISSDEGILYYTELNTNFLNIVIEISKVSELTNITQNIIAYSNFLFSKENVGIERALGTHIISKDKLDILKIIKFNNLISKQDLYKDIFLKYASTNSKVYYNNFVTGVSIDEVSKMRAIIVSANKNAISKIDVNFWFKNITIKIDKLKIIDDHLADEIISNINNEISDTTKALITFLILNIVNIIIFISMIVMILNFIKNEKQDKKKIEDLTKTLEERIKVEVEKNRDKEHKLMEQSRLAQMGEMIGNIAHQWRQPLSAISSIASGVILSNELDLLSKKELATNMEMITNKTLYLSDTVNTFRNFLNDDKKLEEVVLQNKVDKALSIINSTIRDSNITLFNEINYDTPIKILLITGELPQVIINIINNAKDILNEKDIEDKWIKITLITSQNKAIISIEDNGGGIPTKILPKIFEPYFTTKHQSQGTGLGLHMSYDIIKKSMKGNLYATNTKNGAKFFIELPLN